MKKLLTIAALGTLGLTACGADTTDFQKTAASFLRGKEVEQKLGVKIVESSCEKPAKVEKGQTFTCTGKDANGVAYTFGVEITGSKSFLVTSAEKVGANGGSTPTGETTPTGGTTATPGT